MDPTRKGEPRTGEQKVVKKRRKAQTTLVRDVIEKIEARLEKNEFKPTVADLVRLLQLEKELKEEKQAERPKEVKVSWVEQLEEEPASKE